MTAYTILLATTVRSAAETSYLCYRKARRDCYRIHALLTHPRTVQAAKIAVWCLYLGAVVAFTLGQTARILVDAGAKAVQRWAEAEVAACLPAEADHIAEAGEMVEADPFSPAENQHYPAMAATITAPVATLVVPVAKPTTAELRKRCQAAGIRWRNARGKGRHMTNAQMISALS